ncbi:TRAP transporter small permease [bacterium]|nr:TRAP transporter small permease [bacterium]
MIALKNSLKVFESTLAKIVTWSVILILLSMLLLAFLQVILRNFFATGLPWVDIVLRNLVLWIGMLGGVLAARSGRQINIEVLTKLTPPVIGKYLRGIASLFTIVVCYYLVKASWTFVSVEKEFGTMFYGDVPNWYAQMILPIGFALIGLQVLFNLLLNRDVELNYLGTDSDDLSLAAMEKNDIRTETSINSIESLDDEEKQ